MRKLDLCHVIMKFIIVSRLRHSYLVQQEIPAIFTGEYESYSLVNMIREHHARAHARLKMAGTVLFASNHEMAESDEETNRILDERLAENIKKSTKNALKSFWSPQTRQKPGEALCKRKKERWREI